MHAIIQQTQITILLYMNKDADFVFQGVKSFLGACRSLTDVLAAMEWVQPDISFFGEMLLLVTISSADTDTHSYNSNLELLRVFNCYSVEIAIPSLFNTKKKKQGENGTETQLGSSYSTRYT